MYWSPKRPEAYIYISPYTQNTFKPGTPPAMALWNLHWLFDYQAHVCLDGTVQSITQHHRLSNAKVHAAILSDVGDNLFGIKELAETENPVTFMDRMLRRPYQQTMLYQFAGEDSWREARATAERLVLLHVENAEAARTTAKQAVQSAKVFQFKRAI